jgi:beta-galactosidase/beta-glucuronidase
MRDGNVISEERHSPADFSEGVSLRDLQVRYWWPHRSGEQPLYEFSVAMLDAGGQVLETLTQRVGFKHVIWEAPWVCMMNDRAVTLQGGSWGPTEDSRARLMGYREQGIDALRVREEEDESFYRLCDELGLVVWQGVSDVSAVERLQHHVSVLLWDAGEALEDEVSRIDPTRRITTGADLGPW